jgi:hypothetical protein
MHRRRALIVAAAAVSVPLLAVGGLALAAEHARPGTSETTLVGTAGDDAQERPAASEDGQAPVPDATDEDRDDPTSVDDDRVGDDSSDDRGCDLEADDPAESESMCGTDAEDHDDAGWDD